MLTRIDSGLRA